MNLRQLILCLLFCALTASAQDVITKTDNTKIDAKVEEITDTTIRYRKASNPNGPIYSIPVSSVASILFENGSVENFTSPVATQSYMTNQSTTHVDDATLLRMNGNYSVAQWDSNQERLISKAKTFRKVGWVGFGCFLLAGSVLPIWSMSMETASSISFVCGAVAASVWCLGFNLKANSLIRQAKRMDAYSINLIEDEVLHLGKNSLVAGVNVMGSRLPGSQSLGLSLTWNLNQ